MTAISIRFGGQSGDAFKRSIFEQADRVRAAVRGAMDDAAAEFKLRGSADIAGAGKFGSRWTEGINTEITEDGGTIRMVISHSEPLAVVFEEGRTIKGSPMLWIPLSVEFGGQGDAQGVMARDYPRPLFRVNRGAGAPLLVAFSPSVKSKGARGKRGRGPVARKPLNVVYFGKSQVVIGKKFHLRQIASEVASEIGDFYSKRISFGQE